MEIIKSYTDLNQSKKLAEILPLESADMNYWCGTQIRIGGYRTMDKDLDVPCWSLTALLKLMPKIGAHEPMLRKLYYISEPTERYICQYSLTDMTSEYNNPVDACYEMIIRLNKLKML